MNNICDDDDDTKEVLIFDDDDEFSQAVVLIVNNQEDGDDNTLLVTPIVWGSGSRVVRAPNDERRRVFYSHQSFWFPTFQWMHIFYNHAVVYF